MGFFFNFVAMRLVVLIFIFLQFALSSCLKDKTQPIGGCTEVISYSTDIRPIIESSCKTQLGPNTGCHDAWIDNFTAIEGFLDAGIWQYEVLEVKTMPEMPNDFGIDSLTDAELKTMRCWIQQGYPEN